MKLENPLMLAQKNPIEDYYKRRAVGQRDHKHKSRQLAVT
jgi:hypothetical protein